MLVASSVDSANDEWHKRLQRCMDEKKLLNTCCDIQQVQVQTSCVDKMDIFCATAMCLTLVAKVITITVDLFPQSSVVAVYR